MKSEKYNIKDLEKVSGIKAHTIRIWEKRYNLLHPERTNTNIRYYTNDDLKKILNISILNKNGLKISKIASLSHKEINDQVLTLTAKSNDAENQLQSLVMAMFHLDFVKFEKLLTLSYINRGFENTLQELIMPFLTKVGYLWQTGSITPAQEHFSSNIIRHKIIIAIDSIVAKYNQDSKKCILFLPEGEQHELGLLYTQYLLKKENHLVTYIGSSVPFAAIEDINAIHQADYLITCFLSSFNPERLKEYLQKLASTFPQQTIYVSGSQMTLLKETLPANIHYVESPEAVIQEIKK